MSELTRSMTAIVLAPVSIEEHPNSLYESRYPAAFAGRLLEALLAGLKERNHGEIELSEEQDYEGRRKRLTGETASAYVLSLLDEFIVNSREGGGALTTVHITTPSGEQDVVTLMFNSDRQEVAMWQERLRQ